MKRTTCILVCIWALAVGPASSEPSSREEIAELVTKGVDVDLIVRLVEKECVDFDVTAANLAELSAAFPKPVMDAIFACLEERPAVGAEQQVPSPAAAPRPSKERGPASGDPLEGKEPGELKTLRLADTDFRFRWIPPGEGVLGSPPMEPCRSSKEKTKKLVVESGFWLLETEVTQQQWEAVTGENPSKYKVCPECPVTNVSIDDIGEFLETLGALNDEVDFGLPTSDEWEYAARAGASGPFGSYQCPGFTRADCPQGPGIITVPTCMHSFAWVGKFPNIWRSKAGRIPKPVGQFGPNPWGLRDTIGNAREWTADFDLRGGSIRSGIGTARLAARDQAEPDERPKFAGLRISARPRGASDDSREESWALDVVLVAEISSISRIEVGCGPHDQVRITRRSASGPKNLVYDPSRGTIAPGEISCAPARSSEDRDIVSPSGKYRLWSVGNRTHFIYLNGSPIMVGGEETFYFPSFVWLDDRSFLLSNGGGLSGGPSALWKVEVLEGD